MKNAGILSLMFILAAMSACTKYETDKDNVRYQVLCNHCEVWYRLPAGDTQYVNMKDLWTLDFNAKEGTSCYIAAKNKNNAGSVTVKIVSLPKEHVKKEEYGIGGFVSVETDWTVGN